MTIIAGFSSSRQGSAPLNLAAQLARTTGEKIIVDETRDDILRKVIEYKRAIYRRSEVISWT